MHRELMETTRAAWQVHAVSPKPLDGDPEVDAAAELPVVEAFYELLEGALRMLHGV
jgi:hypothetical protein